MGRTISYTITKSKGNFNRKELVAMYNVSLKYNSGNYGKLWSCENFFLNPYDFYPNWSGKYKQANPKPAWDEIHQRLTELNESGMHYFDSVLTLLKERKLHFIMECPKIKFMVSQKCKVMS
jgi:hypothetical protein